MLLLFLFCCWIVFGVGSCVAFVFILFFLVFLLLLLCFCFFGGLKGQVKWPKGPPHLALKPPCFFVFFVFVFLFCFLFFGEGLRVR